MAAPTATADAPASAPAPAPAATAAPAAAAPAAAPAAATGTAAAAAPPAATAPAAAPKIPAGHMGNLSDAQKAALEKVKEWAAKTVKPFDEKDEMERNDYFFLRFLRARKFDVNKTIEMLTKAIAYRRDHHLGLTLDCPPPQHLLDLYTRTAPHSHHKYDRAGHPVYFMKTGHVAVPELVAAVTTDDVLAVHHWDMEYHMHRCREQTKKQAGTGVPPCETVLNVLDLEGIGMHTYALLPYLKIMAKTDEDNYPETMEKTLILNPPFIFNAIWAIVKPWLDPVVASKVIPLSGSDWKQQLTKYIAEDDLPSEYGGRCKCAGGCVPEFKTEAIRQFVAELDKSFDLKELKIAAGKTHDITLDCTASEAAPHELVWYFKSVGYDQAFSVHFTPSAGGPEQVLLAKQTVESHKSVAKSKVVLKAPGKVRFCFDNYSSWRTDKHLRYSLKLQPVFQYPKLSASAATAATAANTTAAAAAATDKKEAPASAPASDAAATATATAPAPAATGAPATAGAPSALANSAPAK